MQYVSSDTNVWIDFFAIEKLELPFKLPLKYIMYEDTVKNELIKPATLGEKLIRYGLESIEITIEEYICAEEYNSNYKQLSIHDCVALAIARERNITLLTGDGALRRAAEKEGVTVIGTIGLLDRLMESELIDVLEYRTCLQSLESLNGGIVRLPKDAIKERLNRTK